ncbi:MAG: hypothetical protein U0L98_06360 [Clostridia bacterium]|nr:hypothetical protein [Clostridia bacterium]
MYVLNNKEKAFIITIAKRVRADYLRKNKYTLLEDDIDLFDENIFVSDYNIEEDVAKKLDLNVCAEEIEKLFTDLNVLKSAKNLSYREKLVLFSYYSEHKTDKEIGQELHIKEATIQRARDRATKKILKNYYKLIGGNGDVI